MGLSEREKKDYKLGLYEIFTTLGSSDKILYLELDKSMQPPNLYSEKKHTRYLDPRKMVGTYKFNMGETSNFRDFTEGTKRVVVTIPLYTFELSNIDPMEVTNGMFEIENIKYHIQSCKPLGLISDMYTSYEYSCIGVDSI